MNASAIRLLESAARSMLVRPSLSETVIERAVWRLKCSVVANVAAGPRRPERVSASRAWPKLGESADIGDQRRTCGSA
jgi:hypothetical protein